MNQRLTWGKAAFRFQLPTCFFTPGTFFSFPSVFLLLHLRELSMIHAINPDLPLDGQPSWSGDNTRM